MVSVFPVNKLRHHNRVQHPESPSWSQASCRVLCPEEHVSLHRAQHPFWWPPLLQDPGVCSSECLSLEHEEAKSSKQKQQWSLPVFRWQWVAGQGGGGRSVLPSPTSPLQQGGLPCQPSRTCWRHPQQVQGQAGGAHGYPLNFSAVPRWTGALTRPFEMWLSWSLSASDCKLVMSMAASIVSSAIKKKKNKHLFSHQKIGKNIKSVWHFIAPKKKFNLSWTNVNAKT